MGQSLVLVTGGSGFVGGHCILRLLEAGHRVRTTVRSPGREADVRAMLRASGVEPGDMLGFAVADLNDDAGWPTVIMFFTLPRHFLPFGRGMRTS